MPGAQRGRGSTTFLDQELNKEARRSRIMDTPQPTPGGLGSPSPQGLGSTPQRPVNPPTSGGDREALLNTPARPAGGTPPTPGAVPTAEPRLRSIARVDEEFPLQDLVDASATGTNVAATNLGERFYRRYGRYPTDVDLSILSARRQFEVDKGRPPSRDELLTYLRQNVANRKDEFLY